MLETSKIVEGTVAKLKTVMFKSLYIWMSAYNYSCFSKKFLIISLYVFFFFLIECFSCVLLVYWSCTPLRFFMRLGYFILKNIVVSTQNRWDINWINNNGSLLSLHG
jgi:hypothetical protein